jgi:hypothetical protein
VDLDERRRSRRRFTFTVPQLAAAAVVLSLVSAATAIVALRRDVPPTAIAFQPALGPATVSPVTWTDSTARYDAAVAQLQAALVAGRGLLDTSTVRVLQENLAIIDRAIAQARAALAADPGNAYLNLHLAQTMRTKLELLRRAQAIAVQS